MPLKNFIKLYFDYFLDFLNHSSTKTFNTLHNTCKNSAETFYLLCQTHPKYTATCFGFMIVFLAFYNSDYYPVSIREFHNLEKDCSGQLQTNIERLSARSYQQAADRSAQIAHNIQERVYSIEQVQQGLLNAQEGIEERADELKDTLQESSDQYLEDQDVAFCDAQNCLERSHTNHQDRFKKILEEQQKANLSELDTITDLEAALHAQQETTRTTLSHKLQESSQEYESAYNSFAQTQLDGLLEFCHYHMNSNKRFMHSIIIMKKQLTKLASSSEHGMEEFGKLLCEQEKALGILKNNK